LSTPEIAKAFLLPEPTLAQRLVRAKRKIQEARIPYEVPPQDRVPERLASVQAVIYLIFNEGYAASSGTELVRNDLCAEAIRLGRVLCELLPREAENKGLLALMLLHHSRRDARVLNGELVTLEEQDRSRWDRGAISEGLMLVETALNLGPAGPYQLQAAIAALHAEAARSDDTDWPQIAGLYEKLLEMNPSPVVALNHAVAVAMDGRLEAGLNRIEALARGSQLDRYYLFHAARADLLRRLNQNSDAAAAYRTAAALATNPVEVDFLNRRLRQLKRD
jgi:RNA polymerase sigma-70 factor (ECF subfamily)